MMPSENILLKYLDKTTTLEEDLQVEQWISASPKNRKYLQELLIVHFESNHLKKHIDVDADAEWNIFLSKLSEPHKPIEKSISRRKIFYYVAAASVIFLLCFQFLFNTSSPFILKESGNRTMTVVLPDNSNVTLFPKTSITYAPDFTDLNQRKITLEGKAKFEVIKNPSKPFIVETNDFITQVLGTVFTVSGTGNRKGIKVHEGSVRASDKKQIHMSVTLKGGESVQYLGTKFSDISTLPSLQPADTVATKTPKTNTKKVVSTNITKEIENKTVIQKPSLIKKEPAKPKVKLSKFTLKDVFDFLNDHHPEKDKFSKSRKCKPKKEDTISLNLQEDLASILKRIEVDYNIEYENAKCQDCFRIKSISKK